MSDIEPRAYSPEQFCRAYSCGLTRFYELIKTGELKAVKCGRRTLVMREEAERWLHSLPEVHAA